ncbi:MAG: TonB-dependent receptor [Candidatus Nitrotoga sp.]
MLQNKSRLLLLAITLCAAISSTHAQTESAPSSEVDTAPQGDNELVVPMKIFIVTGTRIGQPLKQTLSHATVINQQEIQDSQATDVPSLLKNLAGIEFYQSSGIGKQASLFMRGTNSSHVLILLDGVRINSATTGATAIDQLMLDQIERIEVVRGNVSSMYGSEAIGGVIQIFTKRGRGEPAFSASVGAGSKQSRRISTGYGGQINDTQFNVRASHYRTDGISAINPQLAPNANPDNDGYENASLSANVHHTLSADHGLSGSFFRSRGEVEYDDTNAFGGAITDVHTSSATLGKFSLASDNRLAERWQSKLQLAQGRDDAKGYLNGMENPGSGFKTTNRQLTWQNTLAVHTDGKVLLGLEKLKQQVASDTAFTRTERRINSLFAGYTGNYGAHQVQTNLRQDRYADFGKANTGLLGYGYVITDTLRVTASASTAFKAPTFNDLYYPLSFGFSGNPNLKPERSRNRELGLRYANDMQHVNIIYFDNRIRDLIAPPPDFSTVINVNTARINGIELSYAGQFANTGIKAAYTRQNPRDELTNLPLLRRAKSFANLSITQQMQGWRVAGEAQRSGPRVDSNIMTFSRITLPGYTLINLLADYTINQRLNLSMRVDNLLNKDYMLAHGYNTLGRTVLIGLSSQQ